MKTGKKGAPTAEAEAPNKKDWRSRLISDEEPPQANIILQILDTPILMAGNYTAITGEKKSRKSLLGSFIMSQVLGKLLIFDTEQSPYHVWQLRKRVKACKVDDKEVLGLHLRGLSIAEKKQMINEAIADNPDVLAIMIDNLRDLLPDLNNPTQSQELIDWLESITMKYNVALLVTIHTNPGSDKMRGHVGTELQNKSYLVMQASKKDHKSSTISCQCSRDKDFPDFSLGHHETTGMPEVSFTHSLDDAKRRKLLEDILGKSDLSFKDFLLQIRTRFGKLMYPLSVDRGRKEIHNALSQKWIVQKGRPGTASVRYSLNRAA